MCKWYEQPPIVDYVTELMNYVFTAIFGLEAIFKLIGFGHRVYFSEGWNKFDFTIIVGSVLSIFLSLGSTF